MAPRKRKPARPVETGGGTELLVLDQPSGAGDGAEPGRPRAVVGSVVPGTEVPAVPRTQAAERSLLERLFAEAYRFDFFQAVHILEEAFGSPVGSTENGTAAQRIRFRPHDGQAFAAADVRAVRSIDADEPAAEVIVTFMGLYGVSSPLPAQYAESISNEQDDERPHQAFLDIFHQRLYTLFYQSWKKYRFDLVRPEHTADPAIDRLRCTAGLAASGAGSAGLAAADLLPFAGILRSSVRNAEGLRLLLDDLLPGFGVRIVENVARWVDIPDRLRLGSTRRRPFALGTTGILGARMLDESGGFRIVLGPLAWEQYEQVLRGRPRARLIEDIVSRYVSDSLDYDVELRVWSRELPVTSVGSQRNRLGVTTWLGRPRDEVVSEMVKYDVSA